MDYRNFEEWAVAGRTIEVGDVIREEGNRAPSGWVTGTGKMGRIDVYTVDDNSGGITHIPQNIAQVYAKNDDWEKEAHRFIRDGIIDSYHFDGSFEMADVEMSAKSRGMNSMKPSEHQYNLQWNWTVLAWQYYYAKRGGDRVDFLPQMSWSEAEFGSRKNAYQQAVRDGERVGMVIDPDATYRDDYVKVYTEYDWKQAQSKSFKSGVTATDSALLVQHLNRIGMEWDVSGRTYDIMTQNKHGDFFAGIKLYPEKGTLKFEYTANVQLDLESMPEIMKVKLDSNLIDKADNFGTGDFVNAGFALNGMNEIVIFESFREALDSLRSGQWYLRYVNIQVITDGYIPDTTDWISVANDIYTHVVDTGTEVYKNACNALGVKFKPLSLG